MSLASPLIAGSAKYHHRCWHLGMGPALPSRQHATQTRPSTREGGSLRVEEQADLVAQLREDTEGAEGLLATYIELLEQLRLHRDQLKRRARYKRKKGSLTRSNDLTAKRSSSG